MFAASCATWCGSMVMGWVGEARVLHYTRDNKLAMVLHGKMGGLEQRIGRQEMQMLRLTP